MRLTVGPWALERQTGRPYFVRGYRLEPAAWVLRAAKGRVVVPAQGEPRGYAWARARVFPVSVRFTGPDGRHGEVRITPMPSAPTLFLVVVAAIAVAMAWRRASGRR